MRNFFRTIVYLVFFSALTQLFCSFDEATDLGSGIINEVDPDKVDVDRHYVRYLLDSTMLDEKGSFPKTVDTGFGVHPVDNSVMVVGRQGSEEAVGFVRFLCTPDTNSNGERLFYLDDDSLVAVKLIFGRVAKDTAPRSPLKMKVFSASSPGMVFAESEIDTPCTLSYIDSSLIDSVTLPPGPLCDSIFSSCRSMDEINSGDTFGFGLRNIAGDTLYRLYSESSILKICVRRHREGKSDTVVFKPYIAAKTMYVAREDSNQSASLEGRTVSSYAPSRTAVYRFDPASLWKAMDDAARSEVFKLVSAGFMITHPDADTNILWVQYCITASPLMTGADFDKKFDTGSITIPLPKDSTVFADVRRDLQQHARLDPQPESLYLYLRLVCNRSANLAAANTEQWQSVEWDVVPYLKTIIYIP
jgi:hypothetical protein